MIQIDTIDLEFQNVPHIFASYLVRGAIGTVLVETGPGSTLPALLAQLAKRNLKPSDIDAVIVTHIHLDHAGAGGWWTRQGVPLYVHHFGARHLIDPSRLLSSAKRIYGNKMDELWGEILPAIPALVYPIRDGDILKIADITFMALETPGHAVHHHTIIVEDVAFTGDAAGIHIAKGWVDVPAPPPEFHREMWLETIQRLKKQNFRHIYPTHFGLVEDVETHFNKLHHMIVFVSDFIKADLDAGKNRDEIVTHFQTWAWEEAQNAGISRETFQQYITVTPHYMSVDGIIRYWQKYS
jgi:glyoxylase-like metal-dependent hydrolase (beta-lactamase superfamily II)